MDAENAIPASWMDTFRPRLEAYLRGLDWNTLIAKRIDKEQSLLAHTLVVVDTVFTLCQRFQDFWRPALPESEVAALVVAAVVHDSGKVGHEFQRYIRGERKWTGHWDGVETEARAREVADLLRDCADINLTSGELAFVVNAARGSVGEQRKAANLGQLATAPSVRRESLLRDVLGTVDWLASCPSVAEARGLLDRNTNVLARGLRFTHHQVRIRGAITAFLHQALQSAHEDAGWRPLLFYADGTVYAATSAVAISDAALREHIEHTCHDVLMDPLQRSSNLVVGSVLGTFLPKPELFDVALIRTYLRIAGQRARPRKPERVEAKNVVEVYDTLHPGSLSSGEEGIPFEERLRIREELGGSQPEMAIFKFFKNIVDRFLSGPSRELVRERYEELFGTGTFALLMGMSTLMPAKDYLKAVRWYHESPGATFGCDGVTTMAEERPQTRQEVLVASLADVAEAAFSLVADPPGAGALAKSLAQVLHDDVLFPAPVVPVQELAQQQLAAYSTASNPRAIPVCPTCNSAIPLREGMPALSDFYDKPDSFSNRRVAHGRRTPDIICRGCYYERLILPILVGERPKEIVLVVPEMQLSPAGALALEKRVRVLDSQARQLTASQTFDPHMSFDLTATWQLARALEQVPKTANRYTDLLHSAFTYRGREETFKKRLKDLAKALAEIPDVELEALSAHFAVPLPTWEAAAEEAVRDESPLRSEPEIMRAIRRIFLLDRAALTVIYCHNFVMVPLVASFGGPDDADVKAGIKRLMFSLFLSASLNAVVATLRFGEVATVISGRRLGVAYVPAIGALRRLVGTDWISRADVELWLAKLSAAVDLTALADYPKRNDYYTLATDLERGRVVRRIEQVGKGGYLDARRFAQIEALTGIGEGK